MREQMLIPEFLGKQKRQKRPELLELILQRCACQHDPIHSPELRQGEKALGFGIFYEMCLVQDQTVPSPSCEHFWVDCDDSVSGETDVEFVEIGPAFSFFAPVGASAEVAEDFEAWKEAVEFFQPVASG